MLAPEFQFWRIVEFTDLAVDARANEPLRLQVLHKVYVFAFPIRDDRCKQHQARTLGNCEHLVDHLADSLRLERNAVVRAARGTGARK